MNHKNLSLSLFGLLVIVGSIACSAVQSPVLNAKVEVAKDSAPVLSSQTQRAVEKRWYVYRDGDSQKNHGFWSNWMPENAGQMMKLNLMDKADPYSGDSAVRIDIAFQTPGWCGIAVASAPNYWGERQGPGFDLSQAHKLVFYAKGERGTEVIEVKLAIAGDKKFGDSARSPVGGDLIRLTKDWVRYEISLANSGTQLKRVITPFVFVAASNRNASTIAFYLDEIYFEMGEGN